MQAIAVPAVDASKLGVADADCILQHGLKHRRKIAGRAADNLEHLRRRRLLLQRLGKLAVRSVRSSVRWRSSFNSRVFSMAMTAWPAKFWTNFDLLVGEGPHLLSIDGDDANQLVFLSIGTPTRLRAFAILIVAMRMLMPWVGALLMSSI